MIYLIGTALAFFLALLLVTKRGKTTADLVLAVWTFLIGGHLALFYSVTNGYPLPYLLGVELPLPLVHGPFLYLYTGTVTGQSGLKARSLLHFAPFVCGYLLIYDFLLLPQPARIDVYNRHGAGYELQTEIIFGAIVLSGIIYVALSLWRLRKHRHAIRQGFSSLDKINLAWLRYLIYSIAVIWTFVLANLEFWTFGAVVAFIFFLGYFGIRQTDIFTQASPAARPGADLQPDTPPGALPALNVASEPKTDVSQKKYGKSGLSGETAAEIHKALVRAIEEDKVFTDSELSLAMLADRLETLPNYLSQVINTFENKSFYDYINYYRIEEFKRLVGKPGSDRYNVLALAYDCGFASKTSFNRNFKNVMGISPSGYLRQQRIPIEA